jgi:hypothetical protein
MPQSHDRTMCMLRAKKRLSTTFNSYHECTSMWHCLDTKVNTFVFDKHLPVTVTVRDTEALKSCDKETELQKYLQVRHRAMCHGLP